MTVETAANAISGFFGVLVLSFLWLGPVRSYLVNRARDRMFEARDEFFDGACQGLISFDDPNYRAVRESINNSIQFAHAVSSARMAWTYVWLRNSGLSEAMRRYQPTALKFKNLAARELALQSVAKVDRATAELVFWKTPVLSIVLIAIFVVPKLRLKLSLPEFDLLKVFRPFAYLIQVGATEGT